MVMKKCWKKYHNKNHNLSKMTKNAFIKNIVILYKNIGGICY